MKLIYFISVIKFIVENKIDDKAFYMINYFKKLKEFMSSYG